MSYNLMHPDWSRVPVQGRDEIVADILRSYRPDVAAIQEAGAKWHKALIPLLTDTGEYAFACRKSNAEGFIYCCTTFLYNPQTVRPVDEYILDLDFRDAARVFSVAVFERLNDGAQFVVTNAHPAPRDTPEKYARNMADLTAFAAELRQRPTPVRFRAVDLATGRELASVAAGDACLDAPSMDFWGTGSASSAQVPYAELAVWRSRNLVYVAGAKPSLRLAAANELRPLANCRRDWQPAR